MKKQLDGLQFLKQQIAAKTASLSSALDKQKTKLNINLWRSNKNSSRQSNKNSIENSLKFFDIYKNLK